MILLGNERQIQRREFLLLIIFCCCLIAVSPYIPLEAVRAPRCDLFWSLRRVPLPSASDFCQGSFYGGSPLLFLRRHRALFTVAFARACKDHCPHYKGQRRVSQLNEFFDPASFKDSSARNSPFLETMRTSGNAQNFLPYHLQFFRHAPGWTNLRSNGLARWQPTFSSASPAQKIPPHLSADLYSRKRADNSPQRCEAFSSAASNPTAGSQNLAKESEGEGTHEGRRCKNQEETSTMVGGNGTASGAHKVGHSHDWRNIKRRIDKGWNPQSVEKPAHIPNNVWNKLGRGLHRHPGHPLGLVKKMIEEYFTTVEWKSSNPSSEEDLQEGKGYIFLDDLHPIIEAELNFDDLLIPKNHVSRGISDTYYMDMNNQNMVLRTQGTAHQSSILREGVEKALWAVDVIRRDEIDAYHFPIFHQIDGLRLYHMTNDVLLHDSESQHNLSEQKSGFPSSSDKVQTQEEMTNRVVEELKMTIEGLVDYLFGKETPRRWDYESKFPFTNPSFELEIYHNNNWLEILGCGIIKREILENCNKAHSHIGWAFGMGLERIAMALYDIPDIRYFWSEDPRFWRQFQPSQDNESSLQTYAISHGDDPAKKHSETYWDTEHVDSDVRTNERSEGKRKKHKFRVYSNNPPVYKDISFFIDPETFHNGDFFDACREIGGDELEEIRLVETYEKGTKTSKCFRLTYRGLYKNLTHSYINEIQQKIIHHCREVLKLEIR